LKKLILVFALILLLSSENSHAQYLSQYKNFKDTDNKENSYSSSSKNFLSKNKGLPSTGASVGFNLGLASIEAKVGFAIGAFAEINAGGFSFLPQANYWNAGDQNNFELAGLARFYLSPAVVRPYLDGGLGVNFLNTEKTNTTKLGLDIGGGVEMANIGTSFNLIFDGKYKLIIKDNGNLSCFVFTAGMKFPFK
jgi:hypothetical protein